MTNVIKRSFNLGFLLCFLFMASDYAYANDYLELKKHYMVYTSGANSIHFKIPVWAYGRSYDYYLDGASSAEYIVTTTNTNGETVEEPAVTLCNFRSERYGENENKVTSRGTAWLKMAAGQGLAVVTSIYNGTRQTVYDTGEWSSQMVVQQVESDDCPQVTMLEFDWYPPESLNEKTFVIRLNIVIHASLTGNLNYTYTYDFSGPFSGANNLMAPQLSEPYLYTVNASGVTGYGQAAVQYTTFQQPLWYVTNKAPNDTMRISDRSGSIYVNTTDTVQEQFSATFGIYRDEAVNTTSKLTAPPVDIPPFHRIYNFQAIEEQDSMQSLTGNNVLKWEIKNPELKDLVDNDYFEIQRATQSDYSDAQTLNVIHMRRDEDGEYSYVDDSYLTQIRTTSGTQTDTVNNFLYASKSGYVLYDAGGKPMCEINLTLSNTRFVLPSAPVYYRIRRASSSLWGWEHEFARTDTVYKHNYLAPLAPTQNNYFLDEDYTNNHTVHFNIKLDNAEIGYRPISIDDCNLTFSRVRTMSDTVDYEIQYDYLLTETNWWGSSTDVGAAFAEIYVYAVHDGEEVFGAMPGRQLSYPGNHTTLRIPTGSSVTVTAVPTNVIGDVTIRSTTFSFVLEDHASDNVRFTKNGNVFDLGYKRTIPYKAASTLFFRDGFMPQEKARIQELMTTLKQIVMPALQAKNQSYGRCIWDRTARLLLCRTNMETGQTMEIIVPQDSIRRQDDGSWLAHITDVAGEPCTHYTYAVRIDQSDASIHVSDSSYLNPVRVSGPDLYFDESATITSFTATKGEAQANFKNGVQLAWKASSAAVDEYVLTRILKNSDMVPDTLLRTVDTYYFDESALPAVNYEYTVTALYSCNGKNTSHSATAEGWRTQYGQISGNIFMPDNSGMAGVQVSLSANGQTIKTITTNSTGTYLFDSLAYNLTEGTVYTIMPASQYGEFSYNNTSSGAATVSLAADRAIVSGIDFVNTSSARITGRILYKNSTIPVAGAAFILNGDTVRRNGTPLLSGIDGAFELSVPKSQMLTLQVTKEGHTFEGNGILRPESGSDQFSLVKPLDGVRFYDTTKVRLVGRVAGGNDQKALKHGFGLGRNNLGDDLQLVLMLEGDNTAHIVHDPDDLSRDTMHFAIDGTETIFEQKRIIIRPDVATGEFAADLFPVKYKVVQATANGYATLFPTGTGSETFDLTYAPLTLYSDTLDNATVEYNAVYDRIYHTPVQVALTQLNYGMEAEGLGETEIQVNDVNPLVDNSVPLYTRDDEDGEIIYLLGYPVFMYNRRYQFMASTFEEYRYNNEDSGTIDRVPLRSGSVTVQNGMSISDDRRTYELDENGRNKAIWLTVDDIDVQSNATNALRTVSVSLQSEGNTIEAVAFQAYVEGSLIQPEALQSTEADITLLDIVRDPGGNGSSAYIESGTTYKFAYTENYHWKAGITLTPSWSAGITQDIGMVAAPAGAGSYIGATYSTKRELSFDIPIVHEWKWGYKYDYTFTTTDRISTSTSKSAMGVGANADVFVGVTTSQLAGKAKTIALITDSLYQVRQPAIQAGAMKVLRQGFDTIGNVYYLVTAEKVVLGSQIGNTFAYSQGYIMKTIIPMYIMQRQNLLMNFGSEEEAQEVADASGEPVYWNLRTAPVSQRDTLTDDDYMMIVPDDGNAYIDRVKALDNMIWKWTTLIYTNEKEKVMARTSGQSIGTFSVNYGNTFTHSDSYSAMANYNEMPQGWDLILSEVKVGGAEILSDLANSLTDATSGFLRNYSAEQIGKSVSDAVKNYYKYENGFNLGKQEDSKLGTKTNSSEFEMGYSPVFYFDCDDNMTFEQTQKKTSGFTIVSDDQGDITVSVYRAPLDSVWKEYSANIRDNTNAGSDLLYGSYVFFTQAGSTFCPYEPEERTMIYNEGTLLNTATEQIAKPEMNINTFELTNIPSDQRAKFRIELKNAGQVETGQGASGQEFNLSLVSSSNPDGAKLYINGAVLARPVSYFIRPGETISQVLEVEKGETDDYENLSLIFGPADCPKTFTLLDFSVHFLPESSPVQVSFPRDKWVMNTLSAKDSIGYYLPVTIDGFDVHHKNFDHIEFQYKLSTENDDAWVNQCSFYADDSLYNSATGNKAMIENGRITPFRFYGERDPKELSYDLRAVSFCRYGSGFVTKSSPVISGTKDTRPPVLFGKAQPANGILTLEDNISLRFSEPIAGNWLDEDNNFQILGVTNTTGITQTTSLYFDGAEGHNAGTKAKRELAITDLTIDMLIKPAVSGREMTLLSHGDQDYNFSFSLTADNRLKLTTVDDGQVRETKISKPMSELSTTDFTRVIMVYNFDEQSVRFYAGTLDITDSPSSSWLLQNNAAAFTLGSGLDNANPFHGNMMEVRVWTKPLTPAEISNTHLRHLTGYEYGLVDYYPMNESKGDELTDLASGATLYTKGLAWTTPQGISLATGGAPVRLTPELFARSEAEDYTLLFWFRSDNDSHDAVSLFGTAMGDSTTMQIMLQDGNIRYTSGNVDMYATAGLTDSKWHHCALVISKTFNSGSLAIDGETLLLFPAMQTGALSGTSTWLAKGLDGNIDDVCLFEQALPAELVREFGTQSPNGEEMGLINLLTFSQTRRNASNVMEQAFSPNNQRVFKDANGNTIAKEQPLLLDNLSLQADKNNSAPVRDRGQLTNLPFTWNYQLSDLLINIKAQPREINKRTMYLTVRDVEDINGNRLPSPVMWTVYADLNSVRWNERTHQETLTDDQLTHRFQMLVSNTTGMTRQYTIGNLPEWLTVSPAYGTLEAEGQKTVTFTVLAEQLKIGLHTHIVYLTDDQGLTEPLLIEVVKESEAPYTDVDLNKYPYNMSLCGRVLIDEGGITVIDTDEEDIVYALYRNECVGMANCTDNGELYLTIYGNEAMTGKSIHFQLWKAETGKTYNITPGTSVLFKNGQVYGCGTGQPVLLTAADSEMQTIALKKGWNWISVPLEMKASNGLINNTVSAEMPWHEGDLIKNPASRMFCTYSEGFDAFVGTLTRLNYAQMYMVYVATDNNMHIFGDKLPEDSMRITLRGGGQWSVLPCLFDNTVLLRDALSDYYNHASTGDIIKSHDRFAVFSSDGRWQGNLTALKPGEGYLFRRLAPENVTVRFYNTRSNAPRRAVRQAAGETAGGFSNPYAATNMTMIAKLNTSAADYSLGGVAIKAFIDGELVAVAEPVDSLYFITIQSDKTGDIQFQTADGQTLVIEPYSIRGEARLVYKADAHAGSLNAPVVLTPCEDSSNIMTAGKGIGTYKIIENNHVIIIRNNERYDVTGRKLPSRSSLRPDAAGSGM